MAIAPERMGIGITRRFTQPGADPYDGVEWERRDARISHWATGAVAFEQLGVEVPSTWSVNATNILAQKYFRGTMGTSEREWSLKQVADRVVDAITAWGHKDGYFVDDAEADAFSAELKYLIVHQKAAFNSPVWFNIGVQGVPQQASACQPYDSLVNTPDGLIPIGRLVEQAAVGTKVFDASGITQIVAVKANGRKDVLRVHTKAGVTLDVTADHLVWRCSGQDSGRFVEAGDLRPGDQLSWHRTESWGGGEITMREVSEAAFAGNLEIERIEPRGEMDVYDIQTESGEYLSESLRVHNCFILSVEDSMDSILNWYKEEGTIFKGGSGAGVNLSRIRSSKEGLRGGGTASGPVSFMRGADASAGTIKSGGKTRRAAKMVILDVGHPDIEDFIWCKAIEERKARALRDAGFDMDLDGKDSHSIQYQNANNSVRVTDEFMEAVVDDADWHLRATTTGEIVQTVRARNLFRQISKAAWDCADPGMQFDTTINKWHTSSNTGRINGSNPCFTGDALVHTDKGLIAFQELFARANQGETFGVYTHDATNAEAPAQRLELTTPEAFMITGRNEIVRLRFDNGMEVRCTPGHRLFTTNRGYVEAQHLTAEDKVKVLDLPAPAVSAEARLPVATTVDAYQRKGDHQRLVRLPEKWSPELGHLLGWLVGDGSVGANGTVSAVYGTEVEQREIAPAHAALMSWMNGDLPPAPSIQANGTQQLRMSRRVLTAFFDALGLHAVRGPDKRVPWSVFQAPQEATASFLQGLFDADGCVRRDDRKGSYVGLGSSSRALLVDVQRLLTTFGVTSSIYASRSASPSSGFPYVRADGSSVDYKSGPMYDLRIAAASLPLFASRIGSSLSTKTATLNALIAARTRGFYKTDQSAHLVERVEDGYELTYNLSEPRNHSYVVNGLVVRNCSEYMHLDNSACNLASLNVLTFLEDDGTFDVEGFTAATEVVFTAQEILVGNADYPTEAIAETSRRFRQLGIGYANLGALLMAVGLPYDSDEGRAWAAAITALLTGHSYATSARTAARMGPFAGFTENREPMLKVLRMHRDATSEIDEDLAPTELLSAAQQAWDSAVDTAEKYGVRNSQASVLAPTGCLVGGSLVATERGLVRLESLGDPEGHKWQDLGIAVATDEGPQQATKFYVNGLESVVTVQTAQGHRIQGTPQHRIKVVDPQSGEWVWKRFAEISEGDKVPLALNRLVGHPQVVPLPPLPEAYWTGEHPSVVPRAMTADLAELVGYFMGDGSLHSRGLRFCVSNGDDDVVARLCELAKGTFGFSAAVAPKKGYHEVRIDSVRIALWWEACGFAKVAPNAGHTAKGWVAHIPSAVLHSNDRVVYGAFLRGLYEADGDTSTGYPTLKNTSIQMVRDAQTLLLAMGIPTTMRIRERKDSSGTAPLATLRVLNLSYNRQWFDDIGFMSTRKSDGISRNDLQQSGRNDHIPLTRAIIERLAPANDRLRRVLLMELARGTVSRRVATELADRSGDAELQHLLSFFYDTVESAELGEEEFTFDLSVPANVTYVANGFVSHNTIGLLMDCDTTGVEPDLGLVKMKKLVGGGTMSIVNQTVPRALARLGYDPGQVGDIIAYIDQHSSIIGAPHLRAEHLPVFACSMGDNTIHYRGHIRMMGAVQPFISGAISKTVNVPEEVTVEEVEQLHIEAWQLGIKAIAMYRDNCKVGQPLSTARKTVEDPTASESEVHDAELALKVAELEKALERQTVVVRQPIRERLPRRRKSITFAFRVADCEGYVTVGEYDDGRPGEVFMKVSKQGSTLAGIMDAFAIAVSLGLQHGVPLSTYVKKYTNMRFEPAGMTDDPELRIAQSLVDYIFRRLAVDYLPLDERSELGVLTSGERLQPTLPGVEEFTTPSTSLVDGGMLVEETGPRPVAQAPALPAPGRLPHMGTSDAPYCYQCGVQMQRAGSCHACPSCGTTSGCS
jgi:ribonucleoside-diphosphate reductase alpha chain